MIFFFLLSCLFLFSGLMFCYFFVFFLFFCVNVMSWGGYFFFFDGYIYFVLMVMTVFIMILIVMSESGVLVFLSGSLVLISFFFFFCLNMMMLYIFFELSVFPILVMILGYGSQVEKVGASYYLIFYALFCSSPFLYVYFCSDFFLFFAYYDVVVSWEVVVVLTLCFLVKFPVYFLHLWLPKAHVEAPTVASMLLAGLLLKLGTVGFLRLMGLYNGVFIFFWVFLSVCGMVLGSFLCFLQSDVKSLVAYSSIVHMGFVLFVLVVMSGVSKVSGVLMMVVHGYISVLMFYLVGGFYHVVGSRIISYVGGVMVSGMSFVYVVILVFLCNGGLPPSLSFFSEFLGLVGMYLCYKSFFVFLILYFFVAFYFSLYVLVIFLMGSNFLGFDFFVVLYMVPGVFLMFNFFWIGLFF